MAVPESSQLDTPARPTEAPEFMEGSYWYVAPSLVSKAFPTMAAEQFASAPDDKIKSIALDTVTIGNAKLNPGQTILLDTVFSDRRLATFRVQNRNNDGQYVNADKTIYSATLDELAAYVVPEQRGIRPRNDLRRALRMIHPFERLDFMPEEVRATDPKTLNLQSQPRALIGTEMVIDAIKTVEVVVDSLRAEIEKLASSNQ